MSRRLSPDRDYDAPPWKDASEGEAACQRNGLRVRHEGDSIRRAWTCLGAALLIVGFVGCDAKKPSPPHRAAPSLVNADTAVVSPSVLPVPVPVPEDTGGASAALDVSRDCGDGDHDAPREGKSIGHTSAVFKLVLSSGKKVAWKPNAKRGQGRYRGEVAAFRFAKALGLDNVPPACARVFDATTMASTFAANDEAAKLFAAEGIVTNGNIAGVVIPWIDKLTFWPLEKEPLRTETRAWLTRKGRIPGGKRDLARQVSTLVAFDFMTGNWDRYSGENVGIDHARGLVLYIDNDAAFMSLPPTDALARNRARVDATDRFSRSFVARVRELDEDRVAWAIGDELPGQPLLSRVVIAAVARRAHELTEIIDAKTAANGDDETLLFP